MQKRFSRPNLVQRKWKLLRTYLRNNQNMTVLVNTVWGMFWLFFLLISWEVFGPMLSVSWHIGLLWGKVLSVCLTIILNFVVSWGLQNVEEK